MGAEAPQWLFSSFVQSMQELGATATPAQRDAEARELLSRWNEPGRTLHNVRHLIDVLAHLDELSGSTHDPDVLRIAAWYHGLILNRAVQAALWGSSPQAVSAECAELTHEHLTGLGISDDVAMRVADLIRMVAIHTAPRDDVDAQVLVDADLASIAAAPQEYKKFRQSLREEYEQVDDLAYLRARRIVVRRLLARDSVFHSPGAAEWESRARENLEAELAKLDEAILEKDPSDISSASDNTSGIEVVDGPTTGQFDDAQVTSSGAIIIRRKHLKWNNCSQMQDEGDDDDVETTSTIPVLAPEAADGYAARPGSDGDDDSDNEDASSLETAIETLDVPSRPSSQS